MNLKQWLGLDPEHTFYESFTAYGAAGITPEGEAFVNLCDDPGKTRNMIELSKLPAMPSRLIYRHMSGIQLLDVVQSYEFKDGLLTLEYRGVMARLMRARGCQVSVDATGLDLPEMERVLKFLFANVKPDFPGLPPYEPGQKA